MRRTVFLIVLTFSVTVVVMGLVVPEFTQAVDARLLIAQSLAVMGGATPTDSVATGTATLYTGESSDAQPFKVTTRGLHEYREERTTGNGPVSLMSSRGRGFVTTNDGRTRLSGENAVNDYCPYFPLAGIMGDIANGDLVVEYIGQEIEGGRTLIQLRLMNTFASVEHLRDTGLGKYTTTDVWLDAATMLPAGLSYSVFATDAPNEPIPVEIQFDSYQEFDGSLYPTKLTKFLNGTHFADIEITQVQFNVGVTDADLDLDQGRP